MRKKENSRTVTLYFRDQSKVMRAIPNVKGVVWKDTLAKVYTLYPLPPQEIEVTK